MITKNCEKCNKTFNFYPFDIKERRFCGLKCYWESKVGSKGYWSGKKRSKEMIDILTKAKLGKPSPLRGRKRPDIWKGGAVRKAWWTRQRQVRKFNNGGSHTFEQWEQLKAQYNWTCPCCKRKEPEIKLTQDHIFAVSMGGSDNIENIQPLCGRCNSSKQTKQIKYEQSL